MFKRIFWLDNHQRQQHSICCQDSRTNWLLGNIRSRANCPPKICPPPKDFGHGLLLGGQINPNHIPAYQFGLFFSFSLHQQLQEVFKGPFWPHASPSLLLFLKFGLEKKIFPQRLDRKCESYMYMLYIYKLQNCEHFESKKEN